MHHSWYSKSNELESLNHHEVITTPKKFLSACDLHQIKCGSTHSGNLKDSESETNHIFFCCRGQTIGWSTKSVKVTVDQSSKSVNRSQSKAKSNNRVGARFVKFKNVPKEILEFLSRFSSTTSCEPASVWENITVKYMYLTVNETYHTMRAFGMTTWHVWSS